MNNKMIGFAGAGLLIVGLFVPIATLPFLGSVTMMSNGFNIVASSLLVLGLVSGFLVWADRRDAVVWTGGSALLTVVYMFGRLQWSMSEMQAAMAEKLDGNPFAGIAQAAMASVGLQWGWLVLAAGPALLVYVAVQDRRSDGLPFVSVRDGAERIAAVISIIALLVAPAQDLWRSFNTPSAEAVAGNPMLSPQTTDAQISSGPTADEAAYIKNSLRLYEFEAKYFDSLLDGRVPGVTFKIKNEGDRTIKRLTVKVVFFDAADKPIAEELYYPVNVGAITMGNEDKPLRPNYIWQQEADSFYMAKMVPSEWSVGKASATITDIDFDPSS